MFLKFQFDGGLDAVTRVLVGLFQSEVHQVLVIGTCYVATDKDDDVGQHLYTERQNKSFMFWYLLFSELESCF